MVSAGSLNLKEKAAANLGVCVESAWPNNRFIHLLTHLFKLQVSSEKNFFFSLVWWIKCCLGGKFYFYLKLHRNSVSKPGLEPVLLNPICNSDSVNSRQTTSSCCISHSPQEEEGNKLPNILCSLINTLVYVDRGEKSHSNSLFC